MPKFIVFMEETPRSKKRTWHIGKLAENWGDGNTAVYQSWGVTAYASEALSRVEDLNRTAGLAAVRP